MRLLVALCLLAGAPVSAFAQAQPPAKPPAAPAPNAPAPAAPAAPAPTPGQPPAANPASTPPQPENFTYNADGRRDPFVSLIGAGAAGQSRSAARTDTGVDALGVNEISVRGVMQSRGALVAMVEGPNKKTYLIHQGDKLLDGVVKTVTPQGLVVIQEVNDPLSLVKQREVSKLLRSLEGGK